jgi:hypothetical protein
MYTRGTPPFSSVPARRMPYAGPASFKRLSKSAEAPVATNSRPNMMNLEYRTRIPSADARHGPASLPIGSLWVCNNPV